MTHINNLIITQETHNNIDSKEKEEIIPVLNQLLAEFTDLALITKQAHWNMKGHNFISVHEMLDPFNEKLLEYTDKIAERIVQLGGTAFGRSQDIVEHTPFSHYPTNISMVEDHLNALLPAYATLANHIREIITTGNGDETTRSILTDASEDLDKFLWFIEAQINKK